MEMKLMIRKHLLTREISEGLLLPGSVGTQHPECWGETGLTRVQSVSQLLSSRACGELQKEQ